MAYLIALETKFGVAFVRFVTVLATENASVASPFVRALADHVAKLFAPVALDCGVAVEVVPVYLVLQLREMVFAD